MKSRHPFLFVAVAALLVIITGIATLAPRDPSLVLPKQGTNELPPLTLPSYWLEVVIILAIIVIILGIALILGYRDKNKNRSGLVQ